MFGNYIGNRISGPRCSPRELLPLSPRGTPWQREEEEGKVEEGETQFTHSYSQENVFFDIFTIQSDLVNNMLVGNYIYGLPTTKPRFSKCTSHKWIAGERVKYQDARKANWPIRKVTNQWVFSTLPLPLQIATVAYLLFAGVVVVGAIVLIVLTGLGMIKWWWRLAWKKREKEKRDIFAKIWSLWKPTEGELYDKGISEHDIWAIFPLEKCQLYLPCIPLYWRKK